MLYPNIEVKHMTVKLPVNLGALIRNYRKINNLTRDQFAVKVDISKSLIRDLENGKHDNVTIGTLGIIVKELGLGTLNMTNMDSPSPEQLHKHQMIQNINAKLYLEDPLIIQIFAATFNLEIEKIKQNIETYEKATKR